MLFDEYSKNVQTIILKENILHETHKCDKSWNWDVF